jgi:hypothetical protein
MRFVRLGGCCNNQFPVSGRLHGLDPVAHQIEQNLLNLDFIDKHPADDRG